MHLYSWAFIAFVLMVIGTAILLLDDRHCPAVSLVSTARTLPLSAFVMFFVLAVGNVISTVLICGGGFCPETPAGYLILNDNLSLTMLSEAF